MPADTELTPVKLLLDILDPVGQSVDFVSDFV